MIIIVTRGVLLRGFKCPMTGMWHIPLVDLVRNNNTKTVIVNRPPSEFLPARPPPTEAIHNVYELKTQPKLMRYYHAAAGFPTKPMWLKAIKNKKFASWPGLTVDVVNCHYPNSDKTPNGHGRKALSGLQSIKVTTPALDDSANNFVWKTAHARPRKNAQSSIVYWTWRTKQPRKFTPTNLGDSPRTPATATNTSWSSPRLTAMQFLLNS